MPTAPCSSITRRLPRKLPCIWSICRRKAEHQLFARKCRPPGPSLLVLKQPLLAPQPAAIAAKVAVGANHAMTRDDDGQAVAAIGSTDGAHGARVADLLGELQVRPRPARRNRL